MTCVERDQNLLMLAHDALPWSERLMTQLHLRGCARCRTRLSEFGTVSRGLAWTISGRVPQAAYAMPAAQAARPGHPVTSLLITGIVLIIVAEATVTVVRRALGLPPSPPALFMLPKPVPPNSPVPAYPQARLMPGKYKGQCPYDHLPRPMNFPVRPHRP